MSRILDLLKANRKVPYSLDVGRSKKTEFGWELVFLPATELRESEHDCLDAVFLVDEKDDFIFPAGTFGVRRARWELADRRRLLDGNDQMGQDGIKQTIAPERSDRD